jgi:O-antigen ligase
MSPIERYPAQAALAPVVPVRDYLPPSTVGYRERVPMLLVLACALVAFNFGRLNELLPASQAPFYRILLPLGVLTLLPKANLAKCVRAIGTPQGRALGIFAASMLLSVPFSLWPGGSFQAAVHYIGAGVPVIILTAAAIQSERDFAWVMRTLVAALIVLAVALVTGGVERGDRVTTTTTYDPNDIAMVAVVALPPAIWLQRCKQLRWRVLGVLGIVAALVIVTRAASRGGVLGFAAVMLVLLFASRQVIARRWRVAVLIVSTIMLGTAPAVFWNRLSTLESLRQDYNVTAESGRVAIWERGVGYFLAHPLTGVGMEQYPTAEATAARRYVPTGVGIKWFAAHNMYIQAAAELGFLGLLGLLGLIWPTVRSVRWASRAGRMGTIDPALAALGQMLLASIVGFMVTGFFLSAAYGPATMTIAALGMAYHNVLRRSAALGITTVSARA